MAPSIDWAGCAPHIVVGLVVGLLAFAPLAAALWPICRGRNKANMTAGVLALGASFGVLVVGALAVHLLTPTGLVPFAVGETAAFIGALAVMATVLVAKLGK